MGGFSTSSGSFSIAIGDHCNATGGHSIAMGNSNIAEKEYAIAMGTGSRALGFSSTAIGWGTVARGDRSVAMGGWTTASNTFSTALGFSTESLGYGSVSMGCNTITRPCYSLVIGMYNDTIWSSDCATYPNPTDPLFIIGNGYGIHQRQNALTVQKSGRMAIGNIIPTQMLDVNGNARFRSVSSGTYAFNLNLTSDGILTTATSDISMKENIIHITNALENVTKLRGVYFNWKNEPEMGHRIGFIAQEVEQVIPELVFTNPTDGLKGVNYAEMTAVLVEALKEQQQQIESYKSQLQTLQEKVDKIEVLLAKALDE